ncbi:MAG: radical SAM family heme chaperone HemW [Thermodesulfobacteriota bacterium]
MVSDEKAGIYIHVPFCIKKCRYCNFYSLEKTDENIIKEYVYYLKKSVQHKKDKKISVDSIYFGGGTPSLLDPAMIEEILFCVYKSFTVSKDCELTLEVNPGSVGSNYFKDLKKSGINRLNIGIQSFNDRLLKIIGRVHSSKKALETFSDARKAGFENIGADLIYCLPGQSEDDLFSDLSIMTGLRPDHISAYMLTLEKKTPLFSMFENNELDFPGEDKQAGFFLTVCNYLKNNKYLFYEISNYALSEEKFSRHNLKYWNQKPYLGFGPSAHSYIHPYRWSEPESFEDWINNIKSGENKNSFCEYIDKEKEKTEFIYLNFRTEKGLDFNEYKKRFYTDFKIEFKSVTDLFLKENMIHIYKDRVCLTEKGFLFSDYISLRFLENI